MKTSQVRSWQAVQISKLTVLSFGYKVVYPMMREFVDGANE